MNLEGKYALVTGGAKRIGKEIILSLAKKGVNCAIHYYTSKEEALALSKEIEDLGVKSFTIKADCKKRTEIERGVQKILMEFGKIDFLINNAAIFHATNINDITEKDWDNFLSVNLKAPFWFSRIFANLPNENIRKIVNIADTYSRSPSPNFLPYGTSKAGLAALSKGLAKRYSPDILVNTISPGPVLLKSDEHKESYDRAIETTLLKRSGGIEDITRTVIFLLENDYITGQEICIDGGRHLT